MTLDRINNFKGHIEKNMLITCKKCNVSRKTKSIYLQEYQNKINAFAIKYKDNLMCVNSEKEKEIFFKLREKGIVGGPSMVFHRYHEVNKTKIRHTEYKDGKFRLGKVGNKVKYINSNDANSLYPYCYMYDMPCGEAKEINVEEGELIETIQKIIKGEYYGFVECSLKVNKKSYNKYCDFPPFFVTKEINGVPKLSSYMECEDVLVSTDLFLWYLAQKGIFCSDLKSVITYKRGQPFKEFVELSAEMRRDNKNPMAAAIWKLMANSSFGKMAQNNASYSNTLFTIDLKKANRAVNKPEFLSGNEYTTEDDGTLFEISTGKKIVNQNMPIQGACMIYSGAKKRMLEFVYDFIDRFIEREDYQIMYMDTDSCWGAYSEENPFETLIKPKKKKEFSRVKKQFLVYDDWSSRTPGLFKNEYEANKLICLASKSYFAEPRKEGDNKLGAKGIQKRNNLGMEKFEGALFKNKEYEAVNKGFRFAQDKELGLQKYEQRKRGVNGDYDKRGLLKNGINTYPLPW